MTSFPGLTSQQVKQRTDEGKVNIIKSKLSKSNREIIASHTLTYFNFLNIFLAVLIFISGEIKNATFMIVVITNAVIGIVQEIKVKNLIDKLSVITASHVKAIRDATTVKIPITSVVQDDYLLFENGDQICADCRVMDSQGLEVNESMLTGESKPVRKNAGDTLLSGSFVVAGSAVAAAQKVGDESYAAILSKQAKSKKRASSEMQRTINKIIKVISILIIPVGIILFISQKSISGEWSSAIVQTVAGIIGMIPEGLVLLTSISFILGVGRLAKKHALVQEMEAIEALARVNVLCLDKTGTITTGELEVKDTVALNDAAKDEIARIMGFMANSFDDVNATQNALMASFKAPGNENITELLPFSSDRKYRALTLESGESYVLGAPEFLAGGNEDVMEKTDSYSQQGMRVLLLGKCDYVNTQDGTVGGVESMALIIISDCIRPTAKATFDYFKKENVEIKIISGDSPVTVSNIALQAGVEGAENYIDATKLSKDFETLRSEVAGATVFGRVRPEQKQQIIKALQANEKIVGMVGDGVNDVLAIKDADCGIAMAAGSDAAKEVAHIVLMDSDFSSMTSIVKEGRMIISNIERVSALYLTKTIYSLLLSVIFILLHENYPFIPIQLSLISMAAIGVPSFFLALEHTEKVTEHGFLKYVLEIALPHAITMVAGLLLIQFISPLWDGNEMMTSTFNLMLGGVVSIMVLRKTCTPISPLRAGVFTFTIVIFVSGLLIAPAFLGIYPVFRQETLLMLPLACSCFWLIDRTSVLVVFANKKIDEFKQRHKRKKELESY